MMELRRALTGTPQRLYWDLLGKYTFTGQEKERHTITPQPSWAKYDFLFIKTNLLFTPQEDGKNNNWLWYEINDGVTSMSSYEGYGDSGARSEKHSAVLIRDTTDEKWYLYTLMNYRGVNITSSATLADITVKFGAYYGGLYDLLTGTIEVYGGSFREGSAS